MKRIVIGVLAHVDSGKTTLSEALLYQSGAIKKLGRVDHKDAFLDTHEIEKNRGITVFSKQGVFALPHTQITLLDTPGHVDFSAEMERTLQVIDYAMLVVNGVDGIQSHTETLWTLLKNHHIPTIVFVNKMDLNTADYQEIKNQVQQKFSENCIDFTCYPDLASISETIATCDETLMEQFLEKDAIDPLALAHAIKARKIFPCFFGSALKLENIQPFLGFLDEYLLQAPAQGVLQGKVFKISRDEQGNRLTHIKMESGNLSVKQALTFKNAQEEVCNEKVNQIKVYSGAKYTTPSTVYQGDVCAVTGLGHSYVGMTIGKEEQASQPYLQPVISYGVSFSPKLNAFTVLEKFKILQEEDPLLQVDYKENNQKISVHLMGQVQQEIIRQIFKDRFEIEIGFDKGQILYKETIKNQVEGVGHFEPLRHYAEVQLLIEPLEAGKGIVLDSICSEDKLEKSWQRLAFTHLQEKQHIGVLAGAPITDVKITLVGGKVHNKHTEGGDFRQATYRALRQGLRYAESVLLEPWFCFNLTVPTENIGRAMSDIQKFGGQFSAPETQGEFTILMGEVPAVYMVDYQLEVQGYTKGKGRLNCRLKGYYPCHNAQEVIAQINYNPETDLENTADSVFCSHGAGYTVKWHQVYQQMHLPKFLNEAKEKQPVVANPKNAAQSYIQGMVQDKELLAIFERTYGPIKRSALAALDTQYSKKTPTIKEKSVAQPTQEYLLVDGYNVIFAWDELGMLSKENLEHARVQLADILCNYSGFRNSKVILVFDAYKVKGNPGTYETYHNIDIVYTKEAETADMYIEKVTHKLARNDKVRVVTSDYLQQLIILGHGAFRVSAKMFKEEVEEIEKTIKAFIT